MAILTEQEVMSSFDKYINEVIKNDKFLSRRLETAENVYYDVKKKEMPLNMKISLAKNLSSLKEHLESAGYNVEKILSESSYTSPEDVNAFIHHAFDVITAIYPSFVIDEFVSVQGMDRKIGEVFLFDINYGDNKGHYQKGEYYLSSLNGINVKDATYSSMLVSAEAVAGGGTNSYTHTVAWKPIVVNEKNKLTVSFVIGGETYVSYFDGINITGSNILTSVNVDNTTQTVTLNFSSNVDDVKLSYYYNTTNEIITGLPSITVSLRSIPIEAQKRALKTKWLLDSSAMLSKHHGIDLEKEMFDAVTSGILNEIQVEVANDLLVGASADSFTFNTYVPSSNTTPYIFQRIEIFSAINNASISIEKKVRKVRANFVIGGAEFIRIVRSLPADFFQADSNITDTPPVGMHVVGKLGGIYKVIQNFDYPDNAILVGAKGNNFLYTGYVYAPFIPIMASKPIVDENLVTWRSLMTYYGKNMINPNFYAKGKIVNVTP